MKLPCVNLCAVDCTIGKGSFLVKPLAYLKNTLVNSVASFLSYKLVRHSFRLLRLQKARVVPRWRCSFPFSQLVSFSLVYLLFLFCLFFSHVTDQTLWCVLLGSMNCGDYGFV